MFRLPIIALLLTVHVAWPCAGDEAAPLIGPGSYVDDRAIKKRLTEALSALYDEDLTVPIETLRKQLTRSFCELRLPKPGSESLDPVALYADRSGSVCVLGKLYKCAKCDEWHISHSCGFFITEDGVLVTNYHVVDGDEDDRSVALGALAPDGKADLGEPTTVCEGAHAPWRPRVVAPCDPSCVRQPCITRCRRYDRSPPASGSATWLAPPRAGSTRGSRR